MSTDLLPIIARPAPTSGPEVERTDRDAPAEIAGRADAYQRVADSIDPTRRASGTDQADTRVDGSEAGDEIDGDAPPAAATASPLDLAAVLAAASAVQTGAAAISEQTSAVVDSANDPAGPSAATAAETLRTGQPTHMPALTDVVPTDAPAQMTASLASDASPVTTTTASPTTATAIDTTLPATTSEPAPSDSVGEPAPPAAESAVTPASPALTQEVEPDTAAPTLATDSGTPVSTVDDPTTPSPANAGNDSDRSTDPVGGTQSEGVARSLEADPLAVDTASPIASERPVTTPASPTSPASPTVPTLRANDSAGALADKPAPVASLDAGAALRGPSLHVADDGNTPRIVSAARMLHRGPGAPATMTVTLDPARLGRVRVELSTLNGELAVKLHAEQPQGVQAIGAGINNLRSALEAEGLRLGDVGVGLTDSRGDSDGRSGGGSDAPATARNSSPETSEPVRRSSHRAPSDDGQLDVDL